MGLVEAVGKLLVRQGVALAHLREYREAVGSYTAAVHLYEVVGK